MLGVSQREGEKRHKKEAAKLFEQERRLRLRNIGTGHTESWEEKLGLEALEWAAKCKEKSFEEKQERRHMVQENKSALWLTPQVAILDVIVWSISECSKLGVKLQAEWFLSHANWLWKSWIPLLERTFLILVQFIIYSMFMWPHSKCCIWGMAAWIWMQLVLNWSSLNRQLNYTC